MRRLGVGYILLYVYLFTYITLIRLYIIRNTALLFILLLYSSLREAYS